jgi:hypothetical protein
MKSSLLILVLILLSSCIKRNGEYLETENVVVYYDLEEDKKYAEKLMDFWIDNKYSGKRKQYLKISRSEDNKTYLVKVIIRNDFNPAEITFEEIQLFNEIQELLNKTIFIKQPCQIAICDSHFKVLNIPNPINP